MEVKLTPGGSVWMSEASSTSFSSFERKGEFNNEKTKCIFELFICKMVLNQFNYKLFYYKLII